jgi:hypothetical protein
MQHCRSVNFTIIMKSDNNVKLKTILFDPVAPYYADALNTLSSVVQALALGIYGYEITEYFFPKNGHIPDFLTFETIQFGIMFLVVCVLWQRYISHNQLYAWSLGAIDTMIPIAFGVLEVVSILTIQTKNLNYFSFWFACLITLGLVGYLNTRRGFNTPIARITYEEHFAEYGEQFTNDLYLEVKQFEKKALKELAAAFVIMWLCDIIIYLNWFPKIVQKTIFSIFSVTILMRLLYDNIWLHLFKSPKLNSYHFWAVIKKRQDAQRHNWFAFSNKSRK